MIKGVCERERDRVKQRERNIEEAWNGNNQEKERVAKKRKSGERRSRRGEER